MDKQKAWIAVKTKNEIIRQHQRDALEQFAVYLHEHFGFEIMRPAEEIETFLDLLEQNRINNKENGCS